MTNWAKSSHYSATPPCTSQFRLDAEIQRTVKRCWENVPGAMAISYLKEALRTWKGVQWKIVAVDGLLIKPND